MCSKVKPSEASDQPAGRWASFQAPSRQVSRAADQASRCSSFTMDDSKPVGTGSVYSPAASAGWNPWRLSKACRGASGHGLRRALAMANGRCTLPAWLASPCSIRQSEEHETELEPAWVSHALCLWQVIDMHCLLRVPASLARLPL